MKGTGKKPTTKFNIANYAGAKPSPSQVIKGANKIAEGKNSTTGKNFPT